jgi:hypothetical protein
MENIVKNIHLLNLSNEDRERLEFSAKLHKRHSSITFKIINFTDERTTIRAVQNKNALEKYLDKNSLIEKTRTFFNSFSDTIKFKNIIVHPVPYEDHAINTISPDYLKKELQKRGIRIKDVQIATGLETSSISAWVNGIRPMSNIVKAMFYFYLKNNSRDNDIS